MVSTREGSSSACGSRGQTSHSLVGLGRKCGFDPEGIAELRKGFHSSVTIY